MATKFFTNAQDNTLISEFEGLFANNPSIRNLDSVVGFLRASGYFSIRPLLDNLHKVRILIGIDVDKYMEKVANQGLVFAGAEAEVKAEYLEKFKHDIESSPYSQKVEDGMRQMLEDMASGKLELRAHPSRKVHAKIYVLYPDGYNQHTLGAAITGSSNLSGNGLGISNERQYEFNVKLTDYDDVKFAKDEFEKLWNEAAGCPILAKDVQGVFIDTYLQQDATPYELYVKVLAEYFADRVKTVDDDNPFDMPEGYSKYTYQTDAVLEGYQKLVKYNGFFLADVVGLGKTIIATMIAKKFILENGRDTTKVLVVHPPAVEQNWKMTFGDFGIDKYTKFVSNGSLSKVLDPDNFDYWNPEDYDLVLVDEAHKFRSNETNAFQFLQEICKAVRLNPAGVPGQRKKVMLISATPMNNSPQDIYNELLLFQDSNRCTIDGVTNLANFFSPLVKEFKRLKANPDADPAQFGELAKKVRDAVIRPVTVRRTRTDIESTERYAADVAAFPKVQPPKKIAYELNAHTAKLFRETMEILTKKLAYARYQAIAYLKPSAAGDLYTQAERASKSLASISQNGLVKRLESSFYAFKSSLENFRSANEVMLNMFKLDKVYIAPDLDLERLWEMGYSDEMVENLVEQAAEENPKNKCFSAEDFDPKYEALLKQDQKVLDALCKEWAKVDEDKEDTKFVEFLDLLKHQFFKKADNPGQKLVVFSESAKTIEYLKKRIGRSDVLAITAKNSDSLFSTIRENFDANWKTKKDDYNIILTSDVLAEGVNLHRSNLIVNYDTPWNATRLMQRIGRVNRIGSTSNKIFNYVFYPSAQGEELINLSHISVSKLQFFHTTFGSDNKIYSQLEIIDRDIDKLFADAEQLEHEDVDEELPFYEEIRKLYLENRAEFNRIAKLPVRSRTGRLKVTVDGVTYEGDTLVFLKTNRRKCFFRASTTSVDQLLPVEALKALKADPKTQPVPRPNVHFDHVAKAEAAFAAVVNDVNSQESVAVAMPVPTDPLTKQSLELLTAVQKFPGRTSEEVTLLAHARNLVERGVIVHFRKQLAELAKDMKKGSVKAADGMQQVLALARKYEKYYLTEQEVRREPESAAQVVLSESFI